MHCSNIPQCTILKQKCAHVCTFLLQNSELWDICLMRYGICEPRLLHIRCIYSPIRCYGIYIHPSVAMVSIFIHPLPWYLYSPTRCHGIYIRTSVAMVSIYSSIRCHGIYIHSFVATVSIFTHPLPWYLHSPIRCHGIYIHHPLPWYLYIHPSVAMVSIFTHPLPRYLYSHTRCHGIYIHPFVAMVSTFIHLWSWYLYSSICGHGIYIHPSVAMVSIFINLWPWYLCSSICGHGIYIHPSVATVSPLIKWLVAYTPTVYHHLPLIHNSIIPHQSFAIHTPTIQATLHRVSMAHSYNHLVSITCCKHPISHVIGHWDHHGIITRPAFIIMTSSNGNIFCVTGPLCGEYTDHRWIPLKRPVTRSFDVFFDLRLNKRLSK